MGGTAGPCGSVEGIMGLVRRSVWIAGIVITVVTAAVLVVTGDPGPGEVATIGPSSPSEVPGQMSCGPFTFPADALTAEPVTDASSVGAVEVMRRELADAARAATYQAFETDNSQIRVLDRGSGRTVVGIGDPVDRGYLHGPPYFVAVALENRDGAWTPVDWTECRLRLGGTAPPGQRPVTWYLASGAAAPPPDAVSIPIEVLESACASGESADGRIHDPAVEYRPDAVIVTITVEPPEGQNQTCPGNPPTPYVLELDEPLDGRPLLDGGRYPPAPPPNPKQPPSPIADLPADALTPDPDGNVVLYVTNNSATVTPVEMHHIIDGAVLPPAQYASDSPVTEYRFELADGLHQISVAAASPDGHSQDGLEGYFEVTGDTWLVLRYAGDGGDGSLTFSAHDQPPPLPSDG
jgi:hypothetical protein